jgi:hypothetical protein
MRFKSPWQSAVFRNLVTLARRILRPFGNLENRLVEKLAEDQNRRVIHHLQKTPPRNLLLIMPRCVKKTGCRADVQTGLSECPACRECALGDVALLCERFGIKALVAFRSHIAFDMARTSQPDLIIATACHDRLIKALLAVPQYPALLAPLPPMEKMCTNAGVDLVWLEKNLVMACGTIPDSHPSHQPKSACTLFPARPAEGP